MAEDGRLTPRMLPDVIATIPERKDPNARTRTLNHTEYQLALCILGAQGVKILTRLKSEHHGLCVDSLSNEWDNQ
jgi:hypothetical protein